MQAVYLTETADFTGGKGWSLRFRWAECHLQNQDRENYFFIFDQEVKQYWPYDFQSTSWIDEPLHN